MLILENRGHILPLQPRYAFHEPYTSKRTVSGNSNLYLNFQALFSLQAQYIEIMLSLP